MSTTNKRTVLELLNVDDVERHGGTYVHRFVQRLQQGGVPVKFVGGLIVPTGSADVHMRHISDFYIELKITWEQS